MFCILIASLLVQYTLLVIYNFSNLQIKTKQKQKEFTCFFCEPDFFMVAALNLKVLYKLFSPLFDFEVELSTHFFKAFVS